MAYLQKMLSVETNRSAPIVFENADINEGNGYNPSTGVFTASYPGIYKFSITIMAQMDSIVSGGGGGARTFSEAMLVLLVTRPQCAFCTTK